MFSRRDFTIAAATAGAMVLTGEKGEARSRSGGGIEVHGPIAGGKRGRLFGGFHGDGLERSDYVEEEYFVSGTAMNFKAEGDLPKDGRWNVRPGTAAPYKTRVIVHRPRDAARFNGILVCEWTNVSTGMEISSAVNERFYKSGFAYAAISAQTIGIQGFPPRSGKGLVDWDAERYGSLSIPGDSYSYDIFTQVARALRSAKGRKGPDPLGGLKVGHLIALGESQSATRLATYINAVQARETLFSGFLVVVHVGNATELEDFRFDPALSLEENNNRRRAQLRDTLLRDDLAVPVLVLNSETEAIFSRGSPQPDSKWIRIWEVAGAVHGSAADVGYRPDISQRDGIADSLGRSRQRVVRLMPTMEAAALAMVRWVEGGAPLVRQPRLLRGPDGRQLVRDGNGNALGGVRLPEVDVPIAAFDTAHSPTMGTRQPFTPEKVRSLYPTDQNYLDAITAAVQRAEIEDLILPYRGREYIEAARWGPLADL